MNDNNTPVNLSQNSDNQNVITNPNNFNQQLYNPIPNAVAPNQTYRPPTQGNTLVKEGVVQSASDFVCPNCHYGLSRGTTTCMHCGMEIGEVTETQSKDNILYTSRKQRKLKPVIIGDAIIFAVLIGLLIYEITYSKLAMLQLIPYASIIAIGSFIVSYFYLFCYHAILHKARLAWWASFIPLINAFQTYTLMCNDSFYLFWNIIPAGLVAAAYFTGAVYLCAFALAIFMIINIEATIKLARRFGAIPILLILFPFIYMPIIALSKKYTCD